LNQPMQKGLSLQSFRLTSFVFAMKETKDPHLIGYLQTHVNEQMHKRKSLYATYVHQKTNLQTTSWLDQFYFYARILFSSSMGLTENSLFSMVQSPTSDLFNEYYEIYLQEIGESTFTTGCKSDALKPKNSNAEPRSEQQVQVSGQQQNGDLTLFDPTTVFWPYVSKTIHMLDLLHSVCTLETQQTTTVAAMGYGGQRDVAKCSWPIRQTKAERNTTDVPYTFTATSKTPLGGTDVMDKNHAVNEAYERELLDDWLAEFEKRQTDFFQRYMLDFIYLQNPARNVSSPPVVVVQDETDSLMPFIAMMFSMCCLLFYIPGVLNRSSDAPAAPPTATPLGNPANAATAAVQVQNTPPQPQTPAPVHTWTPLQYKTTDFLLNTSGISPSIVSLIVITRMWNDRPVVVRLLSGNIFLADNFASKARLLCNNIKKVEQSEVDSPMHLLIEFIKTKYGEATKETKAVSLPFCAVLGILLDNNVTLSTVDRKELLQKDFQKLVFESAKTYASDAHTDSVNVFITILDDKHLHEPSDEFPLQPSGYNTPWNTFGNLRKAHIIITVQEIFRHFFV